MKKFPFDQIRLTENIVLRKFSNTVLEDDLEWHRDRQDRLVEVLHGNGWMLQRDNSIPVLLNPGDSFSICENEWHRIVKGKNSLVIKITESKKLSKKQKKIAQAAPPPDKITGADFKALRKNEAHPGQYDAPKGSKRANQLDATQEDLKSDDPKRKARAYRRRARMEDLAESQERFDAREIINDIAEEIMLDSVLLELEDILEKKRKKRKKKKSKSSGGLSKAVKKSLDKKAEKRGFTKGSVYSEFRKGLAAWATSGSRKGMSQHQWAHARVNSANPSKKWAVVKKSKAKKSKSKKG